MANISFANLTQDFSIWRDEIDNHATEKLPDTFFTNTASGHYVTLYGDNLKYQNGVPLSGTAESLEIKLGGPKAVADIKITDIDTDFGDYAKMVSAATSTERTTALWSATLATASDSACSTDMPSGNGGSPTALERWMVGSPVSGQSASVTLKIFGRSEASGIL